MFITDIIDIVYEDKKLNIIYSNGNQIFFEKSKITSYTLESNYDEYHTIHISFICSGIISSNKNNKSKREILIKKLYDNIVNEMGGRVRKQRKNRTIKSS